MGITYTQLRMMTHNYSKVYSCTSHFHRRHKWCMTAAPWQPGQLFYMYIVEILV